MAASIDVQFQHAVEYINNLPKVGSFKPSKDTKLMLYGYYKQATFGQCTTKRPTGFFKFSEKKKWDAWYKLGTMTKEDAMQLYIDELAKVKAIFEDAARVAAENNS